MKIDQTEFYKTYFESNPDLLFICTLNYGKVLSNFLMLNKTALQLLNYEEEEVGNLKPLSVIFNNSETKLLQTIDELENDSHSFCEANLLSKDGQYFPVEVNSSLINFNGLNYVIFSCRPISRNKFRSEMLTLSERLRKLALWTQKIREEERKLISREIHDELGQNLTAIKIELAILKKNTQELELINRIDNILKICDETIKSVQTISSKLRPDILDELGLIPAIEWQLKRFYEQTKIEYEMDIPNESITLNSDTETALFRIFQEALTNVARHSNANKVKVSLKKNEREIELQIFDNGKGITRNQIDSPNSLGILGMKERALLFGGEFVIKSPMNKGTLIIVKIPLKEQL